MPPRGRAGSALGNGAARNYCSLDDAPTDLRPVLTTEQALAIADRRQRRSLQEAARFGTAMGSPVRFIARHTPAGAEFEAVMIDSSRACATVSARGDIVWLASPRQRDAWTDAAAGTPPRFVRRPGTPPVVPLPRDTHGPAITRASVAPPAPAPAPSAHRAPAAGVPEPPRCTGRRRDLSLPLGARAAATLSLAWGDCQGECCRSRPLASLALRRR